MLELPWTFSTFDYPTLCELLAAQSDHDFQTAKVNGRTGNMVHTDRGDLSAPLIVDALGWRRVLGSGYQPPDAPLSRGLEVHPWGAGEDMELWIDRKYVPAGYGWSFPAGDETRIGVGSFDPRFHVKDTTVMLAEDLAREPVRYQGNWIPHRLRAATDDGVFFVGDSAGHCLPLTAEGIRTAFYFGIACGRELRAVVEGRQSIASALARYGDFSEATAGSSRRCWPPRGWSRACRRACCTARSARCRRSASWTGASATTWTSRRRSSRQPRPPPSRPPGPREPLGGLAVVVHQLDVVAVGVQHVGAVVAGVVDRALARRAVVAVAGLDRGPVEGVHGLVRRAPGRPCAGPRSRGRR